MSLLLSCTQGYCYHLSKFDIYALVYCIGVSEEKREHDACDGSDLERSSGKWGLLWQQLVASFKVHFSFLLRNRSPILFKGMSNEPSLIKAHKKFPWCPYTLQLGHETEFSSLKEKRKCMSCGQHSLLKRSGLNQTRLFLSSFFAISTFLLLLA